jgi:hypothetical protein
MIEMAFKWYDDAVPYIERLQLLTDKVLEIKRRDAYDDTRVFGIREFSVDNLTPLYEGYDDFIIKHVEYVRQYIANSFDIFASDVPGIGTAMGAAAEVSRTREQKVQFIESQFKRKSQVPLIDMVAVAMTSNVCEFKWTMPGNTIDWSWIVGTMFWSKFIPLECMNILDINVMWNIVVSSLVGVRLGDDTDDIVTILVKYVDYLPNSMVLFMQDIFRPRDILPTTIDPNVSIVGDSGYLRSLYSANRPDASDVYLQIQDIFSDMYTERSKINRTSKTQIQKASIAISTYVGSQLLNMDAFIERSELVYNTYNSTMLSINRDVLANVSQIKQVDFNPSLAFNTLVYAIPNTLPVIRDLTVTYAALQARNMVVSIWRSVWVLIKQAVNRIDANVSTSDMIRMLLDLCGSLSPTLKSLFEKYSKKAGAVSQRLLAFLEGGIDPYVDEIVRVSYNVVNSNPERFGLYIGDILLAKPLVVKNQNGRFKSFRRYVHSDVEDVSKAIWDRLKIYNDGAFNEWSNDYGDYDYIVIKDYPCNYKWLISTASKPTLNRLMLEDKDGESRWPMPEMISANGFPSVTVIEEHVDISKNNIRFRHRGNYDDRFHIYPLRRVELFDESAQLSEVIGLIGTVEHIVLEEYKLVGEQVEISKILPLAYIGR